MNNLFSNIHQGYGWDQAADMTLRSMQAYATQHSTWCLAWSGGKDSTATVTYIIYLLQSGQLTKPERLIVVLADTRLELPPLWASSMLIKQQIEALGIEVEIVMAPIEKRFIPYIVGRGVPPSNNQTFRWCTRQIKVDPMKEYVSQMYSDAGRQILMITGVRKGESAVRDKRIIMSCSRGDGECGQGWYQTSMNENQCATLAPIMHWKLCQVWDWLKYMAPLKSYGAWQTQMLAEAYGHDKNTENDARTGCMGCPLANNDTALDNVLRMYPKWEYLRPLKELRPLWRELRKPQYRLRKTGPQFRKDGTPSKNQNRMGPLTMEARRMALETTQGIERRVNSGAGDMPTICLVDEEELAYIHSCWKNNVWPEGWEGTEQRADKEFLQYFQDGSAQPSLFGA